MRALKILVTSTAWQVFALVGGVVTLVLALMTRDFVFQVQRYTVASQVSRNHDLVDRLVTLGRAVIFERASLNGGWLSTTLPNPESATTAGLGPDVDAAVAAALAVAPADLVVDLSARWSEVDVWRRRMRPQLSLPLKQRDDQLRRAWFEHNTRFLAYLHDVLHVRALGNSHLDAPLRLASRVTLASLSFRDVIGEEAARFAGALTMGDALGLSQQQALSRLRGKEDFQREQIRNDLLAMNRPELSVLFNQVEIALSEKLWPLQDRVAAHQAIAESLHLAPAIYDRVAVSVLQDVNQLIARLQQQMADDVRAYAQAAMAGMLTSILVLVLALVSGGGAMVLAWRRLIRPLRHASRDLRSLISENGHWDLSVPQEGDEIAELQALVAAFKVMLADRTALWQALPDLIVYKDTENRWRNVNGQACMYLQINADRVVGMTDTQVAQHWPHLSSWLQAGQSGDAMIWHNNRPLTREEVVPTQEGDAIFLQVVRVPLFHADGTRRGMVVVGHDVTDRRRAEAATARLSRQHQLILECAGQGITGVDSDGKTIFFNHAASRMTGWAGDEIVGLNQHAILHHSHADGTPYPGSECPVTITLREGVAHHNVQDTFWTKDGKPLPVEFSVAPLLEKDKVTGAVLVFHDISTRLQSETEIKTLLDELQRSNKELERFAYVASHDLRQPLRMITGYMSLLQKRLGESLNEENASFFTFASDGAKRMDRMIRDLLDYSRIGRGHDRESVDLNQVAASALDNLQPLIAETGAVVEVAPDLPSVMAVRSEMERLIQNLVGNSLKFHAPDRVPQVSVGCRDDGTHWVLSVQDNGIGIDPKDHDRLFSIFQRLVPQDRYDGTGIGLASVRKIAENHGGRVWVESQLGQGATFLVALPKQPVA